MQARELQCKIAGIGAWGSYFSGWNELSELLGGGLLPESRNKSPKPDVIPANERRRAPLPVKLAVESSWQATQAANISPDSLACVFVSALGDTDLTDYMCKTLASEHKELSPTKFHNSVHNAPAGYWTISTNTMSAANSVAGYQESVSLTLLEAMVQCESEGLPLMVTFYDAPVSQMLKPLLINDEAFAFSLIICPTTSDIPGTIISAKLESTQSSAWPELHCKDSYVQGLYEANPSAKVLCLAELLCGQDGATSPISLPLSKGSSMTVQLV